jgi:hypothetical protein
MTIPGTKAVAQRMVNAENNFLDIIEGNGFSREEAEIIFAEYRRLKVVKLDAVIGRYSVKHGAYLDKEIMERALNA